MANLTGASQLDLNSIPVGSAKVPGTTALKAFQGGKIFTDAAGDDSVPLRVELTPTSKATYSYAVSATAPYATPTDWIVIRGSATKLVKIVRFEFSGVATAATSIVFTLRVHTVANTAGTSTNPAPIQHDTSDAAATALVLLYSAAPTISGSPGPLLTTVRYDLAVLPAASAVVTDRYVLEMGNTGYEPVVLRGVAQEFAINFAGAAVPSGGVYDTRVVWTEE